MPGEEAQLRELRDLIDRCSRDPKAALASQARGDALAERVGGDVAFSWRCALVRAAIAAQPDDDLVRELYGELVDRYRSEPPRMVALKALGDEIRKLEADGTLPSTLVVRSDRRKR